MYQYFVVLSGQKSSWNKRIPVTLDHPINTSDFSDIEGGVFTVTNWKLLKVTGIFTYLLTYKVMRGGENTIESRTIELDHKITSVTLHSDLQYIHDSFYKNLALSIFCKYFNVLTFQEIPDE